MIPLIKVGFNGGMENSVDPDQRALLKKTAKTTWSNAVFKIGYFVLIFYVPVNNLSVMSGRVFLS